MTNEEITKQTGFEICKFEPSSQDYCEKCKLSNVQLYFQGPTDAGRYYCKKCVIKEYKIIIKFFNKEE